MIEPWPECKPETILVVTPMANNGESTTTMPHSHQQANTHRDQISLSEDTSHHSDIYIYIYIYIWGIALPLPTKHKLTLFDIVSQYSKILQMECVCMDI